MKIFTSSDKYVRHFVRQSIKGGKVAAFNQFSEPPSAQKILQD